MAVLGKGSEEAQLQQAFPEEALPEPVPKKSHPLKQVGKYPWDCRA